MRVVISSYEKEQKLYIGNKYIHWLTVFLNDYAMFQFTVLGVLFVI